MGVEHRSTMKILLLLISGIASQVLSQGPSTNGALSVVVSPSQLFELYINGTGLDKALVDADMMCSGNGLRKRKKKSKKTTKKKKVSKPKKNKKIKKPTPKKKKKKTPPKKKKKKKKKKK